MCMELKLFLIGVAESLWLSRLSCRVLVSFFFGPLNTHICIASKASWLDLSKKGWHLFLLQYPPASCCIILHLLALCCIVVSSTVLHLTCGVCGLPSLGHQAPRSWLGWVDIFQCITSMFFDDMGFFYTSLFDNSVKFYIFTIMAFVYSCVLPLLLVQLPIFGHREHLITSVLM